MMERMKERILAISFSRSELPVDRHGGFVLKARFLAFLLFVLSLFLARREYPLANHVATGASWPDAPRLTVMSP
jgi:hypothetical protein